MGGGAYIKGTLFFVRVNVAYLRLGYFSDPSTMTGIRTVWAYKDAPIWVWRICPQIGYRQHAPLCFNNETSPCGDYFHKDLVAWKDKGIIVYKPDWR